MTCAGDKVVADELVKRGWTVLDKGWPDLLALRADRGRERVMAIELKRGTDQLRPEQKAMAAVFTDVFGVPFYVAREDDLAQLFQRKGRAVVLPGRPLRGLQDDVASLHSVVRSALHEIEVMAAELREATVMFERLPNRDTVRLGQTLERLHAATDESLSRLSDGAPS